MLSILGSRKTLCDGLSRRDLLQIGSLGFLGLTDWFRLRAGEPGASATGVAATSTNPTPRFGQAKSCILLYLFGSPSQHDTFDPKPDAPVEIRGELTSIPTVMPGTRICELLPRIARICDRTTIVRSMTHEYPDHLVAYALTNWQIRTGRQEYISIQLNPRDERNCPFIGSVVDYLDEKQGKRRPGNVPANIALPWQLSTRCVRTPGEAGPHGHFLGTAYDPLWIEFEGEGTNQPYWYRLGMKEPINNPYAGVKPDCRFPLPGAGTLPAGVTRGRLDERKELLRQFDHTRRYLDQHQALDQIQQKALSLVTSSRTREALDIAREPMAMRDKYGMHLFGQSTLVARRLIEAGTRFATVFWDDFGETANAWDTHYAHFPNMRKVLCPGLDQTYVALLEDLETRGLLDETLVVCMSEHGRGYRVSDNPKSRGGGRGHWSEAYSIMLAGGGIARGKVVGETDKRGASVLDTPVTPKDILATMYHLLGIDPESTIRDRKGVPNGISGGGRVRTELLA
jgi:hypothetical protein